jgi:hypothetical protein
MAANRHLRKPRRTRSTFGQRIAAVFAMLAVLLTVFGSPMAGAKPLDDQRAATVALFGAGALCEPTDDGSPQSVAHINHCVLCTVQRVEAPELEAVLIAFTAMTHAVDIWAKDEPSAPLGEVASRPHKPRDPPAVG